MRRLSSRRLSGVSENESVNPMDGVANMADAMLILAVGIMLALIINWKVDITTIPYTDAETDKSTVEIDEDEMKPAESDVNKDDMKELGAIYYDAETGKYYIVENGTGEQ